MNLLPKSSFLGIAVGERSITVAEVAPARGARDRWEARRVAEFIPPTPTGGDGADTAVAGEALGQFLRENGFTPARAVVGVPARWLVAREREVPPASPEQAAEVLRMQAERLFSAELGEVSVDYAGTPDPSAPRNVLLIAMPRPQLDRVVKMVEGAGCDAVAVMPSTLALAPAGGAAATADGLVLNVTGDAVELSVHRAGAPRLLRHLSVRGPDLASQNGSRTSAVASLAGELRRTIATLPAATGGAAMGGAGAAGNMLRLYDGVGLGAADADALAKQAGLALRPGVGGAAKGGDLAALGLADNGATSAVFSGGDARFAPALAPALHGASRRAGAVDFLHPRLARPKARRFGRRGAWAVGVAAAVVLALGAIWWDVRTKEADLAENLIAIKKNEPDVAAAQELMERVGTAADWFDGRPRVLDVLREVTKAFPDENQRVYVTTLTFGENGKGQISGKAADWTSVSAIDALMKLNANFANPRVLDQRTAGGTSNENSFSIAFEYPRPQGALPGAGDRPAVTAAPPRGATGTSPRAQR